MENSFAQSELGIQHSKRKALTEAVIAFLAFCGLSLLSRLVALIFLFVVGSGLFFPIIWGLFTKDWKTMGFTRRNMGQALLWGVGSGVLLIEWSYDICAVCGVIKQRGGALTVCR